MVRAGCIAINKILTTSGTRAPQQTNSDANVKRDQLTSISACHRWQSKANDWHSKCRFWPHFYHHQGCISPNNQALLTQCAMKNLVLKPSNRAVNHVHYPSSHQRNSERPNTANYCSCWQILPQNHAASCQLHALTTVTPPTKAAIMTGSADNSKVYLLLYLQYSAPGSFLQPQSPKKQRRKFNQTQFLLVFW